MITRHLFCAALIGAAVLAVSPNVSADPFTFSTINEPDAGSLGTNVYGINNSGEIVGTYEDTTENSHGFTYNGTTFTTISDPADPNTTAAFGVTDAGAVAGYYNDELTGSNGFVESGGVFTTINNPAGKFAIPFDGNTNIWGISANGQNLAGQYFDGTNLYPYVDIGGTFTNVGGTSLPGAIAYSVNNNGEVVGVFAGTDNKAHGFTDIGGTVTQIDDPNAVFGTVVEGVNDDGDLVGWYYDAAGAIHGFVDIGGVFTTVDDPDALLGGNEGTYVWGINDSGEISGGYTDGNRESHGFIATTGIVNSPEPGALPLLACGLIALLAFARFRRPSHSAPVL